ncbi:MAG TPA: DUF1592 domain-containing protein [Polyangiaceae bacterium]|nr:DUF1592 domain-containing protein [Polyangiaceae bacterium]
MGLVAARLKKSFGLFAVLAAGGAAACSTAAEGPAPGGGTAGSTANPGPEVTVGEDGLIRDDKGNVLCNTKLKDCSAFTNGYDIRGASMGRLNRNQYSRTIKDLLGTALNPQFTFPDDELAFGFDNIGATLRVAPEHMEQYLKATEELIDELFAKPATDPYRAQYITCDPTAGADCWRTVLTNFATKAWRRPVVATEMDRFVTLVTTEALDLAPDVALKSGMRAVLLSPNFMYKVELDPNIDDVTVHDVSAYELATRLSYFIWGTMPDDALFAAAASNALLTEEGLVAELTRMLSDTVRSQTLVDEFGAQWLNVYKVRSVIPSATVFPTYNGMLRDAMVTETLMLINDFFTSEQPINGMLTASYGYINGPLAQHYGIMGVTGDAPQRVDFTGTTRRGVLTYGSFLTGTSNPTRTSPVKRGKHVLERFLCSPPPDPPGDIDLNIDEGSGLENLSVRDRLAEHQKKGAGCAGCHVVMDAIGLGLENFDGVGAYRTADEYGPINSTGNLPTPDNLGTIAFEGASQLADILATDERMVWCMTQKMLTYGLGRGFSPTSDPGLLEVVGAYARVNGGSFRAALRTILVSDVFRKRRALLPTEL